MGMASAVAVAVAVFTLPGLVIAWLSGARGQWAVASAVPVTFGVYGLAAWAFGLTSIRYDVASVAWFTVGIAVLAALWHGAFFLVRRRKARKQALTVSSDVAGPAELGDAVPVSESAEDAAPSTSGWRRGTLLEPDWLIPGAGVLAGIGFLLSRSTELLSSATKGMSNIFQGWDVHWHASVVRYALESGVVSPTRMGELQNTETHAKMYYPTAWHAGAALFADIAHISPIAATNLTGLVLPAIGFPLSVGLIAWRIIGRRGLTAQFAAALAPIIVGGFPVLFWIGHFVGAWPYVAAMSVSGIVFALFMSTPHTPVRCFAAALAFIGMIQLHPSSATVVMLALALWWLLYQLWVPARRPASWKGRIGLRLRDVAILAATGLVGVLALLPQILIGAEQTEEVKSFTAMEDLTWTEAWRAAIVMNTRHAVSFHLNMEPWVWIAAVGAVVLLVWRRNLWAPLFWFLSVCCTVNALRPMDNFWGDMFGMVGSLHYNTAHRLVMPAAMFVVAFAAVAIAVGIRLLTGAPLKKYTAATTALGILATAGVGFALHNVVRDGIERGSAWGINAARDGRLVNDLDYKAFDWLAQQPKAYDGVIFSNPDEGSGWMYAYNDLPAFYKHYLWPNTSAESDTNSLFWHPMRLGQGNFDNLDEANRVDEAARNLHVKYIYVSPPAFWGFQPTRPDMETGLINTPGVTPVYKDHHVIIYAVNAEFSDAEILELRKPGNSPEELPPLRTKAEAGKAETEEEFDQPYIHRPTVPFRGRDSHFEWLAQRDKIKDMAADGVRTGDSVAAEQQNKPTELTQP